MKFPLEKVWSQVGKVNTAYYCAKNERPFSDFPELKELQEKISERHWEGLSYWQEMCWIY